MTERVAVRFLHAMAYDRETFKNKVEEFVGGAYLEFYKAALAKKNTLHPEWIEHWEKEVHGLLDRGLVTVIKHDIHGFKDRRKALAEVVARLKAKDTSYRVSAEHVIKKDYELKKLKARLDDADSTAFWKRVNDAVEIGFAGEAKD
jgi:hypothetical protein